MEMLEGFSRVMQLVGRDIINILRTHDTRTSSLPYQLGVCSW